jgi:hypothetical protein
LDDEACIKLEMRPTAHAKYLMQVCVSATVLLAALAVILVPGFDPTTRNWAFGLTGTILGFWLKK